MEKDILIGLVVVVLFIWFYRKLNTKSADKLSRKPRELVTNNESAVIRKKSQHLGSQKASLGFDINKPVTDSANPAAGISEALQEFNLLMMKDLSPAQHQATLQMLSYYKKPHPLLSKLTKGHLDQKDLLELIKSDAKITAKILFIVNSARFSVQQPIKDINHAIMFLGVSVVRGIAIEFALKHSFEFKDDKQNQAFEKIWQASALSGSLCMQLAKSIGKDNSAELSTLCLLFYLGDLILLSANPEVADQYLKPQSFLERLSFIQENYKTNTAIIGFNAANAWDLPDSMVKDIEFGLLPLVNQLADKRLTDNDEVDVLLCYLACRIAELSIFQEQNDVTKMGILNYSEAENAEFYYFNGILNDARFSKFKHQLRANNFFVKANEIIDKHKAM
jgi:HD-like signal output (HDOD) protein